MSPGRAASSLARAPHLAQQLGALRGAVAQAVRRLLRYERDGRMRTLQPKGDHGLRGEVGDGDGRVVLLLDALVGAQHRPRVVYRYTTPRWSPQVEGAWW